MNSLPVSMPLPLANPGEPVRVMAFAQGRDVEKRLAGMGLTLGCELHLLQHEGGNLVKTFRMPDGRVRLTISERLVRERDARFQRIMAFAVANNTAEAAHV